MTMVFDNIIFSKEKQGGISSYWYELIKGFASSSEAFFYEEKKASQNIFRLKLHLVNMLSHSQLPLSLARLLPTRYPNTTDKILYHSSFYRPIITMSKVCEITTIHDFTHSKFNPNGAINRMFHNYFKYGAIRRASGIICISNSTFNDLNRYCKPKKAQKVAVIYNGVSNDYKPLKSEDQFESNLLSNLKVKDNFLLFVGHRYRYKNFDFVLKLLEELPEYKLVVVGNPFSETELSGIDGKVLDRIEVASGISNNDLNILYNYAHALVYPSFHEGFGIPIIEAMKAGCPVLALNVSSIPEVAGDAAILSDNLEVATFTAGVKRLEENSYRTEIINAGFFNAKRFDWDKCFKETNDFYRDVYQTFEGS